jgi:hypothetical protein
MARLKSLNLIPEEATIEMADEIQRKKSSESVNLEPSAEL